MIGGRVSKDAQRTSSPNGEKMKIGFIGTGNIGMPIAGQLLKAGHRLLVHDLRRANAEKLLAAGAEWVDTPTAVAAECDAVGTCLPGRKAMEASCLDADGLGGNSSDG